MVRKYCLLALMFVTICAGNLAAQETGLQDYPLTTRMFKRPKDYFKGKTGKAMYNYYKVYATRGFYKYEDEHNSEATENPKKTIDYNISKQMAKLYVPEGYDGTQEWGLYVQVPEDSRSGEPFFDDDYIQVLAENKILFAAPYADRDHDLVKMALVVDTIATMQENFKVDDKRIMVGGIGDAGSVAFLTAFAYPKIVSGAMNSGGSFVLFRIKCHGENAYWTSEARYMNVGAMSGAKKKKVTFISYTGSASNASHERVLISAWQWKKRKLDLVIFDDPNFSNKHWWMPKDWFDKAIKCIDGADVEIPEPDYKKYRLKNPFKKR